MAWPTTDGVGVPDAEQRGEPHFFTFARQPCERLRIISGALDIHTADSYARPDA